MCFTWNKLEEWRRRGVIAAEVFFAGGCCRWNVSRETLCGTVAKSGRFGLKFGFSEVRGRSCSAGVTDGDSL